MSRAIGIVAGLIVLCLVLPTVAEVAQAALPVLVGALVLLALIRLALPPERHRRRW